MRIFVTAALALGICLGVTGAGEEKTVKILLIAKDRDHAFSQHEYLSDCTILAKCLGQTKGVQAEVSNGWPFGPNGKRTFSSAAASLMQPASGLSTSLGDASVTLGTKRSSATYLSRARQYANILPPLEVVKSISHLAEGPDKAHHIPVEAGGFLHEKWRHVFGSRVPCACWLRAC